MKNRLILTMLAACLIINTALAKNFSDLNEEHWAFNEIRTLAEDYVVVGYPDGTFRADQPVTKAEFVTMVIKALWQQNYENIQIYHYKDVPHDHWAYNMVQVASEFDILKGYPDGFFRPDENLKKAEAIKIVTSTIDEKDAGEIPVNAFIPKERFYPEKLMSRAEMAVMLSNMRKQALLRPNKKLAEVFTPKKGHGITLENVKMEPNGFIAVIPAGTIIEGVLNDSELNSQETPEESLCVVTTLENYVTEQNYLLIPAKTNIAGEIIDVKKAMYFIRNAKMNIDAKKLTMLNGNTSGFDASIYKPAQKAGWLSRIYRFIVKGKKIIIEPGDTVLIKLTRPIRVDVAKTMVISR